MQALFRDTVRGSDFVGPLRFRSIAAVSPWVVTLTWAVATWSCSEAARGGTLVSFNFTNFGTVQIDLFDDLAPASVNNFVQRYVATGRYSDSMIHRVDTGLGVIQGGGFDAFTQPIASAADPTVALEYSRANSRGTIAMARTASLNSATSQWFINTDDNSTSLGQANGGGYAVFGWVVGPGMSVVDSIAAVPTFAYASPFGQVPLQNFTEADKANNVNPLPHIVVLASATVVQTHPSYQNPFLATDVNNDGQLKANDALAVINDLLVNGQRTLSAPFAGTSYLDTDGNGRVGAADALKVINALLTNNAAPLAAPLAMPMLGVPEPSSLVLGGLAMFSLAGYAIVRRIRRGRTATPAG